MPVTQEDIARRLRAARVAAGLTQDEVAQRLGVARTAIVHIERGGRSVSGLELARLAELYRRDIRVFVEKDRGAAESAVAMFRSFAELHGEAETIALEECLRVGRALTELERLMGLDRRVAAMASYRQSPPRSRAEAVRQGANVALQERYRLGIGDMPIPEMTELLERQGIRTATIPLPTDVAGLMMVHGEIGPMVVVNENEAHVRRRFSLAHEYAHIVLDADAGALVTHGGDREDLREVRANAFAAHLLLPDGGMRRYLASLGKDGGGRPISVPGDDDWAAPAEPRDVHPREIGTHDVVLLAGHFGVSRQVAIFRLRNAGILREAELQDLLKLEREGHGRRLAELLGGVEDERPGKKPFAARLLGLAFEALSRGLIDADRFGELAQLLTNQTLYAQNWIDLLQKFPNSGSKWQTKSI